jgi:dipeptide/tripeptide permease
MAAAPDNDASTLSLGEQFATLSRVFWIANTMEMVERLAYYGLRTVLPIYMVLSVAQGGPEFDHVQKGQIFAWWAAMQSFLPVFTGGYADRYGYKLTVGIAIAVKVIGYLVMAFAVDIGALITGGASASVPGHPAVYWTFLVGALFLAAGTAIFKPGLQGILAVQLSKDNASLGWALFYQLVNVGGFLGPYLASAMRLMDWKWVFVSCAVIVCLNYALLLTFPEPDKETTDDGEEADSGDGGFLWTLWTSFIGICEPRLMSFLVVFSGFWMMFYQLFDLLPNFITDWVDSSAVLDTLVRPLFGLFGASVPEEWAGQVPAEQLINLNAGMIMLLAFAMGYVTGKVRSMTAMIVGILISAAAIAGLGVSASGWYVLAAIALFSIGEMWASPTKMRYFASIAPPGKKGLYLGYVNATTGIGWFIGSLVAGELYQTGGDPTVLGRKWLTSEGGLTPDAATALGKDDVLPRIAEAAGTDLIGARAILWDLYDPQLIWFRFAAIGIVSMIGLIVFDQIARRDLKAEPFLQMGLTFVVALVSYGPVWGAVFVGLMGLWLLIDQQAPQLLPGGSTS